MFSLYCKSDLRVLYLSSVLITVFHFPDMTISIPLYSACSDASGNYTGNPQYGTNLDLLLSSLASNGTRDGFANGTLGSGPAQVYGLVLCRGDVDSRACASCLKNAAQERAQLCPNKTRANIWYDDCRLRYSDERFFSTVDASVTVNLWSNENVSNPNEFNGALERLLNKLANEAAFNASNRMFATGDADINATQKIFGLVQCTRDLKQQECSSCLQKTYDNIKKCCLGRQGGRILGASCNVRFELYRFFGGGQTPFSPPPSPRDSRSKRTIILSIFIPGLALILLSLAVWMHKKRRKSKERTGNDADTVASTSEIPENEYLTRSFDPLHFGFMVIKEATNNFSPENKLGQGGFGPVYKGRLSDGREMAAKRLSRYSGQGLHELKNELVLIAKLKHRNLVRILGCCIQAEEKILIYEFVPNGSLDHILFDPTKRIHLDWETRYKIIQGIARGLQYLHEDSRLRIIHRDLKASNILLDDEMNAKISDFGMSRIFGGDETQGNTSRIAGTFGYMSPEYAMHGQFSVKSDVFSFGVLLLEIMTAEKNNNFYQSNRGEDLLSYAWRHWKEGRALELLDSSLGQNYPVNEVLRCFHIGLLCVQESAYERPTMSLVVLMLDSCSTTVPLPSAPAYFATTRMKTDTLSKDSGSQINDSELSSVKLISSSASEEPITQLIAR